MLRNAVRRHSLRTGALALAAGALMGGTVVAASSANRATTQAAGAAAPNVIKFSPTKSATDLGGRADTDLIELSDGRRMKMGDIRRLTALAHRMRALQGSRMSPALKMQPAATGTPIRSASELTDALKRLHDTDTVQLPSGRLATVAQVKFVQAFVERQSGRRFDSLPQRPSLTGPAIQVPARVTKAQWREILQRPDSTVIESPGGARMTVGELKKALAADTRPVSGPAARQATPAKLPQPAKKGGLR